MQKVNGWQTTDTKWWEKLIWALGPGELKTFFENYQMDTPTKFEHNWSCKGRDQNVEVYSQRVEMDIK